VQNQKTNDPNTIHFTGRYGTYVPINATADTPWVSPDFSDTRASVKLTANVSAANAARHKLDADKLDLLLGTTKPKSFTPYSIIGKLVNRLSERFKSPIEVHVANDVVGTPAMPSIDGLIGIRIGLHPIPDGMDAARFTAIVRQTMRSIAAEMQPPQRRAR
jgi:hypothetical protein